MATVGEESVYTFTVSSESQNISVIILHEGEETLLSGVQLNGPDGDIYSITWTPADNTSVLNLTIVAMDPNLENISSFFNPVVQLCACENGGNCTTDGLLANDFSFIILNCECPEGKLLVSYSIACICAENIISIQWIIHRLLYGLNELVKYKV